MSLHRDHNGEEDLSFSGLPYEGEEDREKLIHKRQIRKILEDRLERKRLKAELEDELDKEFDWDEFDWDEKK